MEPVILAHDLGTTGDKVSLVSDQGEIVAAATAPYGTDFGSGGRAEQSPEDWWDAVGRASREVLARHSSRPKDVSCISFSGQMMGVVALDGAGEPVRPAIIWADTRSQEQCDRLVDRIGMSDAYRICGHRLNPTYSLTKILWLREHEPAAFGRSRKFVQAKDFIAYRLTGVLVTDPSDASSTNAFDQQTGTWSDEILETAKLSRAVLPEIVPSTTVIGTVGRDAARHCGLVEGIPVVIGGGDGPCAAVGAGIVASDSGAYLYLGSSSWVSLAAEAPLHDPSMRTMTFNHVVPGRFVPTATMQAGGASVEWFADVLSADRAADYGALHAAAARAQAADDGLFFLPHLLGERSPYWNPRARGVFVGLARHHGRANMTRAVLEGVAMNLYTGVRAFTENGAQFSGVDAIGGGAVSAPLLQILADVWGQPVRRRNVTDAGSLGAAVVGGVGVGIFDDFSVAPALSAIETEIAPDPAAHTRYQRHYARFLDAYERLEPWFDGA
ncbi:MAG TPA: xylulokinase [Mycobacteriales bacterium]|nr:xylulokinase [Mycobacteriales bacterium]